MFHASFFGLCSVLCFQFVCFRFVCSFLILVDYTTTCYLLVAPCYIVVCNAFALTGRTRKSGMSKPRVPLRSALGYGLLPLQGEHENLGCRNPGCRFALPWAMGFCPFRSDKFGCARHSIQGKLDALLSLARTVRANTYQRYQPL